MVKAFILLITKDIERKAIIKKDKKTTPNDLKLDFKFKICFVEIINPATVSYTHLTLPTTPYV